MGKRGKKKKKKKSPPQPPSSSLSLFVSSTAAAKEDEEEKDFGNKLVYLSTIRYLKTLNSWIKIDPHYCSGRGSSSNNEDDGDHCIRVEVVPEMKIPAHMDLHQSEFYGCCAVVNESKSKVYFTGGMYRSDEDSFYLLPFSNKMFSKMFSYDLTSNKWDEGLQYPHLNVARAFHAMVAIGNVIYVFGGMVEINDFIKEQWVEFYNLDEDDEERRKWEFLPPSCAPPQEVFSSSCINYHAVYECGNQILFFMHLAGIHSFNYVTRTWTSFDSLNNNQQYHSVMKCHGVAIVDHVMFWEYFGIISAYDLRNNQLLMTHCLNNDNLEMKFGEPQYHNDISETALLVSVGKEILLLICLKYGPDHVNIHCYKFRIEKSDDDAREGGCGFRLLLDGFRLFDTPGALGRVLAVSLLILVVNMLNPMLNRAKTCRISCQ